MKKLLVLFILTSQCLLAKPQRIEGQIEQLYELEIEDIKHYYWQGKNPAYSNNEYPEHWEKGSYIYLHFEDYYELKKVSMAGRGVTYMAHRRVKLLDQAGVNEYSEIHYNNHESSSPKGVRKKNYLIIKIIKPDGREIEVDTEQFVKEDDVKKVAVPGLEIGDIIDYCVFSYNYVTYGYEGFMGHWDKFPMVNEHPIKQFTYKVRTDEHWDVKMSTGKFGYEIKELKGGYKNKDYFFTVNQSNIEATESNLWDKEFLSSPFLKMTFKFQVGALSKKEKKGIKPWHEVKLAKEKIIKHYKDYYKLENYAEKQYFKFVKYLKKKVEDIDQLSDRAFLQEYWFYIRHHFINQYFVEDQFYGKDWRKISPMFFTGHMIYALDRLGIAYDIIVVTSKSDGYIEDAIHLSETDYLIRAHLQEGPLYFYRPHPFTKFSRLPAAIEGTEGYVVYSPNNKAKNLTTKKIFIPTSSHEENTVTYRTIVNLDDIAQNTLNASTITTYYGHQMSRYQFPLTNWVKMINQEHEQYGTKVWINPEKGNTTNKEKVKEFLESNQKTRKENFEQLASDHFDSENIELIDFETRSSGNTLATDHLSVRFDCKINDFIKKVGPNYILEAGKLVGGQITLEEEDLQRQKDIYMSYARTFDYEVRMKIPTGFTVQGLDEFNHNIDNATGSVKSNATLSGKELIIQFTKTYKNSFENASNWDLMKAFLIPAADFTEKQLLLKKIG